MKDRTCEDILDLLEKKEDCTEEELALLLRCEEPQVVHRLFTLADAKRRKYVGDAVHIRGLVEFSNFCRRNCLYCGLRKGNRKLKRYRMSWEEMYALCERIARLGVKTIVLQSGEDPWYEAKPFAEFVHRVKKLQVAITLSVGEREPWEYALWRDAGADRYLLKQETFDRDLFARLHPDDDYDARLECQKVLKELGYQVGSGNMVGLPYQTPEALALDIKKFQEWDFDMIGIGPFIPHPDTPLGHFTMDPEKKCLLTLKVLALTRILTKTANLPATTALGTLVPGGRERGLRCGANVLMPNFTPHPYRSQYTIYPGKICVQEAWGGCLPCMKEMVTKLGRTIATDYGDRVRPTR
ncbi:[FeFe] hydrogenase H-cluster radical SAM maturase HydE [Candidatus Caldatribacterium sp. SIUC1]|uniref:[FeFe] hydrogenase H-cluster radical SAM maturase HydE n=1 Tax=Candidatus Caldatribacterium sp. SIUC1 TaxID=3418365 RepID=UPI003F68DDAF